MKHYGDRIEVLSQLGQGQSNIILSSNIKAAKKLNRELKQSRVEMCLSTGGDLIENHSVLHKAAGIIRAEMMARHVDTTVYTSPSDIREAKTGNHLPISLFKIMSWLLDKESFESAETLKEGCEKVPICVSLSECVSSNSLKIFTPLTVGLAVEMHNTFGSRNLIERLHSHG